MFVREIEMRPKSPRLDEVDDVSCSCAGIDLGGKTKRT
jgi:hypothetical protein